MLLTIPQCTAQIQNKELSREKGNNAEAEMPLVCRKQSLSGTAEARDFCICNLIDYKPITPTEAAPTSFPQAMYEMHVFSKNLC
jgi:hypothetical protein